MVQPLKRRSSLQRCFAFPVAAHAKALAAKRGLNNPLEHPLVRAFRSRSQL